jgi:hypothetical protein
MGIALPYCSPIPLFRNTSSMAGKSATPGYENEGRADHDLVTNTQKERW